jgi:glycosyltransferase involved in cell wall biosynthesis
LQVNQRVDVDPAPYLLQGFTVRGQDIWELSSGALAPPLVTFVIINWNYARFVGAAIDSVRQQDYLHFECIVINNGSTDDSAAVIARHIADDRRFSMLTFAENRGQLGAAFSVLDRVKGGLVTFVDADDVLFQNYASLHVQAHMALRQPVGFTSSNSIEMDANGHALASASNLSRARKNPPASGLQQGGTVLRVPTVSDEDYDFLSANTAIVSHGERRWLWGPGTSNMYRTSILRMTKLGDGSSHHMRAADSYFNIVCQGLAGSALLDLSLSAYRIHGSNYFAACERFHNLRSGTRLYARASANAVYDELEYFLREAERFSWMLGRDYFAFIDQIARAGLTHRKRRRFYRNKRAFQLFVAHAPQLKAAVGTLQFNCHIALRFSPWRAGRIFRAAFR